MNMKKMLSLLLVLALCLSGLNNSFSVITRNGEGCIHDDCLNCVCHLLKEAFH